MASIHQFGPARATGVETPTAPVSFGVSPLDVERIHRIFDRPDHIEVLRSAPEPTWLQEIASDFHNVIADVRAAPLHHALFAVIVVVTWTLALMAPIVVMGAL